MSMIDWLVDKGCPVGFTDMIGQTCLFYAARDGRLTLIKHLLAKGLDMNHLDSYGQTAFFYACREA